MNIQDMLLKVKNDPKEIVGVDISEDQITAVLLGTAPAPHIKIIATNAMPDNAADEVASSIIQGLFANNRLPKKEVWLNIDLPPQSVNYSRISLPGMPGQEMMEALRWNLKDKISLELEKAEVQYESSGDFQKEDGSKNVNMMTVTVEKRVIDRFINIFKNAGITLSGISVTPFSISNVLKMDEDISRIKGPVLVCHVGLQHSYICTYVNDRLDFVRQIPLAEQSFISAMIGVFMSDKGRLSIGSKEAKKIIEEFGIPQETDVIMGGQVNAAQILSMVRPVLERFMGEILRSIDYCQKEFGYEKIEKALLAGPGSYMRGLGEFISKEITLKMDPLRLPEGLRDGAALGVAAGYKGSINFVPVELRHKKGEEIQKSTLRVTTTAVLGVLLFLFLMSRIQIAGYERQLETLRHQKLLLKDFKEMNDKISAVEQIAEDMKGSELSVDFILKELGIVTPGNVAFTEVWINRKQKMLMLRGELSAKPEFTNFVLSAYCENLQKTPFVNDAALTSLQKGASDKTDISSFEIKCSLK